MPRKTHHSPQQSMTMSQRRLARLAPHATTHGPRSTVPDGCAWTMTARNTFCSTAKSAPTWPTTRSGRTSVPSGLAKSSRLSLSSRRHCLPTRMRRVSRRRHRSHAGKAWCVRSAGGAIREQSGMSGSVSIRVATSSPLSSTRSSLPNLWSKSMALSLKATPYRGTHLPLRSPSVRQNGQDGGVSPPTTSQVGMLSLIFTPMLPSTGSLGAQMTFLRPCRGRSWGWRDSPWGRRLVRPAKYPFYERDTNIKAAEGLSLVRHFAINYVSIIHKSSHNRTDREHRACLTNMSSP